MLTANDLRKLQDAEFDMLKMLINICKKYDLQYYIIGGTLLGAIRHGGFIPWDDDIDIAMPRKDYEKLINILKEELKPPFKYRHYSVDDKYREYCLKIINANIICYENKNDVERSKTFLWLDILPLDAVPDNKIGYNIFKGVVYFLKALLSFKNIETVRNIKNRPIYETFLIKFAQVVPIKAVINRNCVMKCLDMAIKMCANDRAKSIGTFMGAYRFKEVVPKEYFGNGTDVMFGDISVKAPKQVGSYLAHIYGDYMKLPPKEKQEAHIVKIEFIE